jgi:hypothetical protein
MLAGFAVFHWHSYEIFCGCGGCFNPPTELGVTSLPKTLSVWMDIGLKMLAIQKQNETSPTSAESKAPQKRDDHASHRHISVGPCFDAVDSTDCLQKALQQPSVTVHVPKMGTPWFIQPLLINNSDVAVLFADGVVIEARRGFFHGGTDSLFKIIAANNVTLAGENAGQRALSPATPELHTDDWPVLRMQKDDYMRHPYVRAEWRMGICEKLMTPPSLYLSN